MERKHVILLIIAAGIVIGLWWQTPLMVAYFRPCRADQGAFGDIYGFINALFSGLALLGIIAAILLQQKELSQSTKAQKDSAAALQKQVELSANAARIQVLPGLIQTQKVRIKTIGGSDFRNFEDFDYSDEMVYNLLTEYRDEIEKNIKQAEALQKDLEKPMAVHIAEQVKMKIHILRDRTTGLQRIAPELELLLKYQTDLVQIYQKISSTQHDMG